MEQNHYCAECKKSFSCGKALGGHMSSAHVQPGKDYSATSRKLFACQVCGKEFESVKSVYGHMRCHPERDWRGVKAPPAVIKPPDSDHDSSQEDNVDDDEVGSLMNFRVRDKGLISGCRWGGKGKRGQAGSIPHVISPCEVLKINPLSSIEEVMNAACLLMCLRKSWIPSGKHPMLEYATMYTSTTSFASNFNTPISRDHDAKDYNETAEALLELHSQGLDQYAADDADDEMDVDEHSYKKKESSYKFYKDKAKGKEVLKMAEDDHKEGRVNSELKKRSKTDHAETRDGLFLKIRRIEIPALGSEDRISSSGGEASKEQAKESHKLCKSEVMMIIGSENKKKGKKKMGEQLDDINIGLVTPPKIYKCPQCPNVYSCHQAIGGHMSTHTKFENYNASNHHSICSSSQILSRELSTGDQKLHQCKTCNQVFLSGQALGGHQRSHWNGHYSSSHTRKVLDFDLNDSLDIVEDKDFITSL